MLIVEDDMLKQKDPQKLKPIDRLSLIKRGRRNAAESERNSYEEVINRHRQELLTEASREWKLQHPASDSVDLDQWKKDQEATQQVMKQELELDKQDYLNDPRLWDVDSDKRLQ